MLSVTLYGTAGCHLCEQAEALLNGLRFQDTALDLRQIDIADDEELMNRYGVRIPVLYHMDSGRELGWPFDAEAVARFLRNGG